MSILTALWGKTAGMLVSVVGILFALLGVRHSIRKSAKEEMSNEIKERTLERIEAADKIERDNAGLSDGDIIDKLRDQGFVRD